MGLTVTQEHVDAAKRASACGLPEVGTPVESMSQADLIWFETTCPALARRASKAAGLPLWALAGSGDGSGYGSGSGSGYGDGYGSCSGSGSLTATTTEET